MTKYKNLFIYYFSGTGNAMLAARWIAENGEKHHIKTFIQSIEKMVDFELKQPEGKTLIAFTYPTHGFAVPWIMMKFLWRFPKIKDADVLFVNTKAGSKLWKIYFPGMTGLAQWLSIFVFWLKGNKTVGALPLDVPHSWTSFAPPNPKNYSIQITDRCQRIVNKMCDNVFSGKSYWRYTVWTQLWFDIAVSWIVPLYMFLGRFFLAKTLFSSYKCNGCSLCAKYCPVNAIVIKKGMPFWKINCESCMRCMNICPNKSIQSWITRIALILYGMVYLLGIWINIGDNYIFSIVQFALFPLYWLFIKVMRVKAINVIFTYTSLTKYWNRYIAHKLKAKDLIPHK